MGMGTNRLTGSLTRNTDRQIHDGLRDVLAPHDSRMTRTSNFKATKLLTVAGRERATSAPNHLDTSAPSLALSRITGGVCVVGMVLGPRCPDFFSIRCRSTRILRVSKCLVPRFWCWSVLRAPKCFETQTDNGSLTTHNCQTSDGWLAYSLLGFLESTFAVFIPANFI